MYCVKCRFNLKSAKLFGIVNADHTGFEANRNYACCYAYKMRENALEQTMHK